MTPFLTRDAKLDFTRFRPPSRNCWLISLSSTAYPASASAVAMPLPMRPPPNTPTHFMGRALRPVSVTPVTFLVERWAKKMCTRALCVSSLAAAAKHSPSFLRPATPPCATPVSIASRHSCGWARPGAFFLACSRANCKIMLASPNDSSLSVRNRVMLRGRLASAISSANLQAASMSCAWGTTASTRPSFRAALSLMSCEVSIISMLFCRPTKRGRRCVPPNPGMMPNCSSGRPKRVPGVHTLALQAMATSQPPPRATPWMAATVGLGPPSNSAQKVSLMVSSMPPPPSEFLNCWMSNPGLKLLWAPVTTMARTLASACARAKFSNKERSTKGWSALSGL
mmetsp:Transcript_6691/g.11381  ORF Transcript_6691/g.11381 Transcript_6691/m.11381 type:complete len:340 (-) Transcript_6691:119-1138(-)